MDEATGVAVKAPQAHPATKVLAFPPGERNTENSAASGSSAPSNTMGNDDTVLQSLEPSQQVLPTNTQSISPTVVSTGVQARFPNFDKSPGIRTACIASLAFGSLASAGCIVSGILTFVWFPKLLAYPTALSTGGAEALSLALNIAVALCTDGMAYVHATSLRWALYRENRLQFNTNIRLLSSARNSPPNRWYINVISMACLILCYAATSQLFLRGDFLGSDVQVFSHTNPKQCDFYSCIYLNATAVCVLGLGLLGHAAIGFWCISSSLKYIPTWSSSPLNNTLAALNSHYIYHRPGRCMLSVHQAHLGSGPSTPLKRQGNARNTKFSTFIIVISVWILTLLSFIWAMVLVLVSRNTTGLERQSWVFVFNWYPFYKETYSQAENDITLSMSPHGNKLSSHIDFPSGVQFVLGILFVCGIQGFQTIGLHCVELLVNMSRDEDSWRHAAETGNMFKKQRIQGVRLAPNPFASAVLSWQNATLFMLKAVLHWLLGQSVIPSFIAGDFPSEVIFNMVYMRVIVYSLVATFHAAFATYLAYRRPKGSQPAAWGHLQTLADLIDDWGVGSDGCLWWGDKGMNAQGIRHAGTSGNKEAIGEIRTDMLYAGLPTATTPLCCGLQSVREVEGVNCS